MTPAARVRSIVRRTEKCTCHTTCGASRVWTLASATAICISPGGFSGKKAPGFERFPFAIMGFLGDLCEWALSRAVNVWLFFM